MVREDNCKVQRGSQHARSNVDRHEASLHSHSLSLEMLLHRLMTTDTKQDDTFVKILLMIGKFGTFQWRLVALTFIPNIMLAFFMFADTFMFTPQKSYCNTSWILALGPNLSEAEQLNLTVPRNSKGSFMTCHMYLPVSQDLDFIIQFGLNYTDTCQNGWIYPDTKKRSLINEFNLVCGMEPKMETVQATSLTGLLIGALFSGFISDKVGRQPVILLSLLGLIIFGFGTAFVNSFYQYLVFRFCASLAMASYTISSISLTTEWLRGEHRAHSTILGHCFFAVGIMLLTGLAYGLPHWRLLFLVGGMPTFLFISYIWILPESPQWLVVKGKVKEAQEVLCYAASVNKKTIPFNLLNEVRGSRPGVTKASVLDFCNNRQLFKVTLVMGGIWFAVSYNYFMLSLKMKELGMSIHFSHVIPGILKLPARLCCIFLLARMGRKWSLAVTLFPVTVISFLLLIFPEELNSMMILMVALGEFSLAITVTVLFIYTPELLPTVLRATGLGLVCLASMTGAILALTIIRYTPHFLPIFLSCVSAILAITFTSLLWETKDQPLSNSLEHFPLLRFNVTMTEDTLSGDVFEEAARNAILNTQIPRLDSSSDLSEEAARNTTLNTPTHTVSSTALKHFEDKEADSQAP
ncbi:solute carrier family 22 member 14 [Carlito syrichta]|uniref:Solute carrier family 22 member 14 n=1 Tax=Carlito syrichta TaxID=1868482 RepID=A0A1U7UMK9_CARSF|nr:solute carrier family 22 member 14 [Carlito syrichta]